MGESLARHKSEAMIRIGRKEVRVRVVGASSLGWLEVAVGWGATIEAVVREEDADTVADSHFGDFNKIDFVTAFELPPRYLWNGIMLTTVYYDKTSDRVKRIITCWQPLVAILAIPSKIARDKRKIWIGNLGSARCWLVQHQELGGATEARWHLGYHTRDKELNKKTRNSLVTLSTYHRHLQTALDDTVSGGRVGAIGCRGSSLGSNQNVVGFVTIGAGLNKQEVPPRTSQSFRVHIAGCGYWQSPCGGKRK